MCADGVYEWMVITNFLQGAAYGVIGAWPPMLAVLLVPPRHQTAVTAVASLSNYVGGAAGVVFMPAVATTSSALLQIFQVCPALARGPVCTGAGHDQRGAGGADGRVALDP